MSNSLKSYNYRVRNQLMLDANDEWCQLFGQKLIPEDGNMDNKLPKSKRLRTSLSTGFAKEVEDFLMLNFSGHFNFFFITSNERTFKTNFTMEGINDGQIIVSNLMKRITLTQDFKPIKVYNHDEYPKFQQDIYDLVCKSINYKLSKEIKDGK